jgi:Domain of unknown function (DUF4410)
MKNTTGNSAQVLLARTFLIKLPSPVNYIQQRLPMIAAGVFALFVLIGCASTKVSDQQRLVYERLPRPGTIWIYDFVSSPADIPSGSALASQAAAPATAPTEEEVQIGRELGSGITAQLVDSIREMGLPAQRGMPGVTPQVNDIVIRGYLVSIEQGSTAKRMTIGFGAGGSELTTMVEGYQMTAQGLRKLGSATTGSTGSKGPGAGVGAATWLITGSPAGLIVSGGMKVYGEASGGSKIEGRAKATGKEIADQLKTRFEEQGWID